MKIFGNCLPMAHFRLIGWRLPDIDFDESPRQIGVRKAAYTGSDRLDEVLVMFHLAEMEREMPMFENSIADFLDNEKRTDIVTPRMTRWVKNSCVYRLNQKMMSEKQLFDALVRKARTKFEDMDAVLARQVAQAGIDFCNDNSFLDDNAFAKVKASSGLRSGKSRRRIEMDLNQKGVDPEVIQASLQGIDDVEAAINFARRKAFGPFRKVDLDERRKAREFSAFAINGYAPSLAMKLLHMTRTEVDDIISQFD